MGSQASGGMGRAGRAAMIAALFALGAVPSAVCAAPREAPKMAPLAQTREFRTPKELLTWVYSHFVSRAEGLYLKDDELDRIFSPRMTDLMKRSRRASEILETESAGAAPWIGAQDWDVRNVKIEIDDAGNGRKMGIATFRNFVEETPKPRTYTFTIVPTERGWRIDDMQFPNEGPSARFGSTTDLSRMLQIEIAEGAKAQREEAAKAAASGSLCKFGEGVVFACRAQSRQISICTDTQLHEPPQSWIEYRVGVPGKLDLVHRSAKVGTSGSFYGSREVVGDRSKAYVRFANDGYDYVAYSDVSGAKSRTGVIVRRGDQRVSDIECSGGSVEGLPSEPAKMPSNMILGVPFDRELLR